MEKVLHPLKLNFHLLSAILFLSSLTVSFMLSQIVDFSLLAGVIFSIIIALLLEISGLIISNKDLTYLFLRPIVCFILDKFFYFEVEGREHIQKSGKVIISGNHTGLLDSFIVCAASERQVNFLMAQVVLSWPVIGTFVRFFNVIPVVPGKGTVALDEANQLLTENKLVCIYPEGRCTEDGNLNKFHKGVAYLYKNSGAPVVPFAIKGGFEAWPINKTFPKPFIRVKIQFGQPINNPELESKELLEELKSRVQFIKDSLYRREELATIDNHENSVLPLIQIKSDINSPSIGLAIKENNIWNELSYSELSRKSKMLANHLIESGIKSGDRIAILSESSPEWAVAFFSVISSGAVVVPLDIKLTQAELYNILSDSEPSVLFVSKKFSELAINLKSTVSSIQTIYTLDEDSENDEIKSVHKVKTTLADLGPQRNADETALIVYTSGTTGSPKGVMITFRNLIAQINDLEKAFKISSADSFLSILPMNHLLELSCGFLAVLHSGGRISYSKSLTPREITRTLKEREVTYLICVPAVLKMLKSSIEKEINNSGKFTKLMYSVAFKVSKILPSIMLRKIFFSSIHSKFGNKLKGFISGGAPLDLEIAVFFNTLGLPIYQGYGMTETSPTISINSVKHNKIGSVGRPIKSIELAIADDGEILVKGPTIMKGYYKREDLTSEIIDDYGWLHTGDIGTIDNDGYLYITGRIKNLIVLDGGKKIHPEEVETVLSRSSIIKEVCVTGIKPGKKTTEEIAAIVVPCDELKKSLNNDINAIKKAITKEIQNYSQELAPYKRATLILISNEELPKTSTRKFKRKEIVSYAMTQLEK